MARTRRTLHERELGNTYRDMALFRDDDGAAYVYYASESNKTLYAVRLSDDYTDIVRPAVQGQTWARLFPEPASRSARAVQGGRLVLHDHLRRSPGGRRTPRAITSPIARWDRGPPSAIPSSGDDSLTTFRSQSAFVLPVPAACARCFIYMGDRWEQRALQNSTYIWVPFVVSADGTIRIDFKPRWRLADLRALGSAMTEPLIDAHAHFYHADVGPRRLGARERGALPRRRRDGRHVSRRQRARHLRPHVADVLPVARTT